MNGYCTLLEGVSFKLSPKEFMDLHPFWNKEDDFLSQAKKLFATTHKMGVCREHIAFKSDVTMGGTNLCLDD